MNWLTVLGWTFLGMVIFSSIMVALVIQAENRDRRNSKRNR